MLDMMEPLVDGAVGAIRLARKQVSKRQRDSYGGTLRPGKKMPLWSEVVAAVVPHLKKRGEKAKLARILEIPRQRVHEYFVGRTAYPDAERMLILLHWLALKRVGQEME